MATKDFKSVIGLINNGKNYPAVSLVKTNPEVAATISKLISARDKSSFDVNGNMSLAQTNRANFEQISKDVIEKTQDAESLVQLFPDMELAAQILVSSIISPKDMSGGDIIFTSPAGLLTPEVSAVLIAKIKEHFTNDYKLKPLLPKILREILFESGSYPVVVIPESSIDDLINGKSKITLEGISEYVDSTGVAKSFGILGDPRTKKLANVSNLTTGLESFKEYRHTENYNSVMHVPKSDKDSKDMTDFPNNLIRVIDNPFLLKFPEVIRANTSRKITDIYKNKQKNNYSLKPATESKVQVLTDAQMQSLVYKSRTRDHANVIKIKTKDQSSRKTIGRPLIMRLPPESVIPIHVPGNEEEHIGFFVLIDINGNPINSLSNQNHFNDLQTNLRGGGAMSSYLQDRAGKSIQPGGTTINTDQASKIFTDIVEGDLLERLRTGVYGNNVSVARNEEVYRIMLARALASQTTQLLYLPAEIVTYFAYKYDKNGIGKSLLDDMRVLNSLRAMMLFSRVMATLKNSIGRTNVKLKLDERDPDPNKTIETAIHEISKTRQQYFPLGLNSPTDLVDWIQRSGFEYTFEGHPKIPDMNIDFSEKSSNYAKPDDDLDNELKKRAIMGVGLSPETVDNGFSSEFATTVVSNNILLAKRVTQIQEHFSPLLTDHARKVANNNGILLEELRDIIVENYDALKTSIEEIEELKGADRDAIIDFLLNWFLESFELGLPQPNSITLENQMKSFDIYVESLDKALDAWINASIVSTDMGGKISGNIDNIKAIIKAHYLRKWMAENNVLPELAELTTKDETGKPLVDLFEIQENHISGLIQSAVKLFAGVKPMADAADKDIDRLTGGEELQAQSSTDSGGGDDSGGDGSGEGDGLDGLGGLDDMSGMDDPGNSGEDDKPTDDIDPTKPGNDLPKLDEQE